MRQRGDGETTRQMQAAPQGAVFVWCNTNVDYPRDLARHLGRDDIKIETPSFFICRWRGVRLPVIVDHAASFSDLEWRGYRECMNYLSNHGIL